MPDDLSTLADEIRYELELETSYASPKLYVDPIPSHLRAQDERDARCIPEARALSRFARYMRRLLG